LKTTFGSGYRSDNIELALWHSPDRIRKDVYSDVSIKERNFFAWIGEEIIFSQKFRIDLELRGDYFTFDVNDHIATISDTTVTDLPHASGYAQKGIISPKFNLVYSPVRKLDIYFNSGSGFHSNDARAVVFAEKAGELIRHMESEGLSENEINENLQSLNINSDQIDSEILPRALGSEIGFRYQLFNRLHLGLAGWYLYLEKEYVYVGDGGYAELSDPTQRMGLDFEGRLKINSWLWADVDICFSKGRIIDAPSGENHIPLAPILTSTGGLSILGWKNFDASLRYVYIGDRPANETNTVTAGGYTIFNLGMAYNWKQFTVSMIVENILNSDWNEAQFDTESRLSWEAEPVSEIHFTPGNPRNFQFGLSYGF
jgi:outer membrane receptor protein involved in Fe transport